jgi:integrase
MSMEINAGLAGRSIKVKEVVRAAGLCDELTFPSFRHGGFTEAGEAELSDAEMRAQGRHKSAKVLPRYTKRTMRQVAKGIQKRHAERTKSGQTSQ